jgi:hypothetical protein
MALTAEMLTLRVRDRRLGPLPTLLPVEPEQLAALNETPGLSTTRHPDAHRPDYEFKVFIDQLGR